MKNYTYLLAEEEDLDKDDVKAEDDDDEEEDDFGGGDDWYRPRREICQMLSFSQLHTPHP